MFLGSVKSAKSFAARDKTLPYSAVTPIGGGKSWKMGPVEPFFGCFPRCPPQTQLFFVLNSYLGVGGGEISVQFRTRKSAKFGGTKNLLLPILGVDMIPGRGGGVGGLKRGTFGGVKNGVFLVV